MAGSAQVSSRQTPAALCRSWPVQNAHISHSSHSSNNFWGCSPNSSLSLPQQRNMLLLQPPSLLAPAAHQLPLLLTHATC